MAKKIKMINKKTGDMKYGFYGFSWSCLVFGYFPMFYRRDYFFASLYFTFWILSGLPTDGLSIIFAQPVTACYYNFFYTRRLLYKGYEFSAPEKDIEAAKSVLKLL